MRAVDLESFQATGRALVVAALLGAPGCGGGTDSPPPAPEARALPSTEAARAISLRAAALLGDARDGSMPTITTFTAAAGHLAPRDADALPARVWLPARADGPFRVEDVKSGLSLEASLVGASAAPAELGAGEVVYRGAGPGGSAVIHRVTPTGTEDVVLFERAPARPELVYRLDLDDRVKGLRLVGRTLELLDARGAPRLRVSPPFLVDAAGARHEAALEVAGCAHDTDPRPPWGRPVTPPGASRCELAVRWSGAVGYPAVVDPVWGVAQSMGAARCAHTGTDLGDGRLLVTGGSSTTCRALPPTPLATAEIYDTTSDTWSTTGPMIAARSLHGAVLLQDGSVLVMGGDSSASAVTASAEIYDAVLGVFTPAAPMSTPRRSFGAARLPSGEVLVAGGLSGPVFHATAEIYDPALGQWSATSNDMLTPRNAFTATAVGATVVVAGGETTATQYAETEAVETFDAGARAFSAAAPLGTPRAYHAAVPLGTGEVLVIGGTTAFASGGVAVPPSVLASAERYDPATDAWTSTGPMVDGRNLFAAAAVDADRVLVAGGLFSATYTNHVEIYDRTLDAWVKTSSLAVGRAHHVLLPLAGGGVIAVGGLGAGGVVLGGAETYGLGKAGDPCKFAIECLVGLSCSDAVCCTTPCNGPCDVCAAAAGADQDGTCRLVDPGDQGLPSCTPFVCDGASPLCPLGCAKDLDCVPGLFCEPQAATCQSKKPTGAACGTGNECVTGHCVDAVCCASDCADPCTVCAAGTGACGLVPDGEDPRGQCGDEGAPSCGQDGACDGAGQCRSYPDDTTCGPVVCIGDVPTLNACEGHQCQGKPQAGCGDYRCENGACLDACATSEDCTAAAYCDAQGLCTPKKAKGATCGVAEECQSAFCVDGRCCGDRCDDQCESCAEPSNEGTCKVIAGAPRGARPPCHSELAADACGGLLCDGVHPTSCLAFVEGVACREASCAAGMTTAAASCDGSGTCPPAVTTDCRGHVCEGDQCGTTCASDADCTGPGHGCDVASAECMPRAYCDDHSIHVGGQSGPPTDCTPFKCEPTGRCRDACDSVRDCVAPFVCDLSRRCVDPTVGASSGPAGCSAAGRGGGSALAPALLLGLALGLRRRRARAEQP